MSVFRRLPRSGGTQTELASPDSQPYSSTSLLAVLGVLISRTAVLGALLALPEPARPVPAVAGVDDFAVARSRRYATVVTGALTRQCIDVLEDRLSVTSGAWLREHPGVKVVCRDRSTAYAAGGGGHLLPVCDAA